MKGRKIVSLNGFEVLALVVCFKPVDELLDYIVEYSIPSLKAVEDFSTAKKLKILTSCDKNIVSFRNFVLLPLHIVLSFLSINSRTIGDIACIAKAVVKKFKNEHR